MGGLRRATAATVLGLTAAVALSAAPTAPAARAEDGPIVGTPPMEDAVPGWAQTYVNQDYWTDYISDAVEDAHINLLYPFDPVKPEAYLPNVPVAADDAYVSALPVAPVDLSGFTYDFDGETKTIEQFVTTTQTDVVVLVQDGTVVGEWYANGYAPDVSHQPWSVTKTFVAATVGIAYDQGLIGSLQDPIDAYIPELAGTPWEGVTIENLLQMESGVHWDEGTPVLVVNTQVEQWVQIGLDLYSDGNLGQTRNEFLAALPAAYEQGTEFRYNSGNTQVLAWLTEVLYDKDYNEVLSDLLWAPMGTQAPAVMTTDRVGDVVASHGLFGLPYDFARFGELMRNGGATPEGRQIIPADWVDAMTTMTEVSGGAYGLQTWSARTAAADAYTASGFQGQKITVVPSGCITAVRLSHALGGDIREGDDPFDPDAYGFAVETYDPEWESLVRDVTATLGGCAADGGTDPAPNPTEPAPTEPAPTDPTDGTDTDAGAEDDGTSLPATGGGAALLAIAAMAAAWFVRGRGGA